MVATNLICALIIASLYFSLSLNIFLMILSSNGLYFLFLISLKYLWIFSRHGVYDKVSGYGVKNAEERADEHVREIMYVEIKP